MKSALFTERELRLIANFCGEHGEFLKCNANIIDAAVEYILVNLWSGSEKELAERYIIVSELKSVSHDIRKIWEEMHHDGDDEL